MADTVTLPGTGAVIASDEVTDGTLGTVQVQYVKLMDGDLNSTTKFGLTTPLQIQGKQAALTSGTITTSTSTVTNTSATGYNVATVGITGTYAGVTFVFEGSPDGTNFFTLVGSRTDTGIAETGGTTLTNTTRAWDVQVGAWTQFRVRATAYTSGTATILMSLQTMAVEPVPTVVQGPNSGSAVSWYFNYAPSTTATLTNVSGSASNVTLLASNTSARVRTAYNDSTAVLYLKFGATASTTSYTVQIPPNGYYEFPQPLYNGIVDGIWSAANGAVRLTEET
jgi:hypothetical protein